MTPALSLEVAEWAALLCGAETERLGAAGEIDVIPGNYRRRLPSFARDALRCALPLLKDAPATPIVFASAHGDLASAAMLLSDIAKRELLSPTVFSLSVHNAPAGVLSLCVSGPGDHTAIAAGQATLAAALVDAYARLAADGAGEIIVLYAESAAPPVYAEHEDEPGVPSVFLALKLRPSQGADAELSHGRSGAAALVRALAAGATGVRFGLPRAQARAA